MSTNNPWREIKDKLGITEYLAEKGFSGKHKGRKVHLNCPFPIHSDSTPSFVVYDDDEYYCFGCAANPAAKNYYRGDIFDVVAQLEQIPVSESVLFLAQKVGVPVEGENFDFIRKKIEETESRKVEQNLYAQSLSSDNAWLNYLQSQRGLDIQTIGFFELGLDRINQRLAIPLRDDQARLLGFTKHHPKSSLKYINPPTSDYFKKEEFLYNVDSLLAFLEKENVVYIVEGYFDVMSLWQHGYKQVVGLCGAKFTEPQVKILKKYINDDTRIIFIPDADKTGWNTLETNFAALRQHVKNPVSVITFASAPDAVEATKIKDANDWFRLTGEKTLPKPIGYFETIVQYHISQTPEDIDVQYNKIQRSLMLATEFERARVIKTLSKLWDHTEEQIAKFLNVSRHGIEENLFKDAAFRVDELVEYVTNLDKTRMSTGLIELDNTIRGINPGEVIGIMGRANTCKTLLATDIFVKMQKMQKDVPTMFFSLEMSSTQLQERMVCQFLGIEGTDDTSPSKIVETGIRERDPKIMDALSIVKVSHQNLIVCDRPGLTVEDMRRYIDLAESTYGIEIGMVIVDHLHIVRGPGKSDYERTSNAIKDFRAMIRSRKACCAAILIQTSRKGGSGGDPISMDDARGSGEIEETLDFMIGVWRPELKAVTEIERLKGMPLDTDNKAKKDSQGRYLKGEDNGRMYETVEEALTRARKERNRQVQALTQAAQQDKGIVKIQVLKSRREGRNAILVYKMHGLGLKYLGVGGLESVSIPQATESEIVESEEKMPAPADTNYVPGKIGGRKAKGIN